MERILNLCNEYNQIIIYRHINPDLDAFGSQLGLYFTLKSLYPSKIPLPYTGYHCSPYKDVNAGFEISFNNGSISFVNTEITISL